ncbi:WYL domain-containing protein [Mucilaginibacter pallidiroseus]|uniref:WYL domain-containing protein n=2 Tax=Mucilaginibacter pallidiroseus TaxID=2599295 RepID=A0A563U875_9SPHI|nr:WYL domain-containing protein [Mucilaginibacter pallidiroseus]
MPKFIIGNTVVLQSHPFQENITSIIISGEFLMIPPIMIVTEIINHDDDPEPKPVNKYKCIWFSSKRNQFVESNLLEGDLRLINLKEIEEEELQLGSLVALKTLPVELGKERSFLHSELLQNSTKKTNTSSGLLTFVSPVMSVIEIVKHNDEKDSKVSSDIKRKKIYPENLVKCKWFDAAGEKFSEYLLPIESLLVIPKPNEELLSMLSKAISEDSYLLTGDTLLKPLQLSNRSGYFHLTYFDYVLNKNISKEIDQIIDPKIILNPFKTHAPIFKKRKKGGKIILKQTIDINTLLEKALKRTDKKYLFIKYQDRFGQITTRTISRYELIEGEDDLSLKKSLIKYLRAFCHLRNADRNFRITSIIEVSELVLAY